ncbi:MAG TPA: M20/M25/M40 family metallo-hydrolase, partial [Bacillota bacterium]
FREAGFSQTAIDEAGNVVVPYPAGPDSTPARGALVVSAHLDTVFPEGTDVTVRRRQGRLLAPGIGDNSASVGTLLFLAEGLRRLGWQPPHDLIFLANVGEEGLGDLRGMKHYFRRGAPARRHTRAVLVLDGPLGMISHRSVGSRRLEVTFRGPGGHSWGDFGRPSAVHALGRALAALDDLGSGLPAKPRTTLNAGVIRGGTSVNTIAEEASMVLDLRSEAAGALRDLEARVRRTVDDALVPRLKAEVQVVGDRPMGEIPEDHPLVRLAVSAGQAAGLEMRCVASSTDANLPLSLGIPAVTVGTKRGAGAHTLGEFVELDSLVPGFRYAAVVMLAFSRWVADQATSVPPAAGA